MDVTNIAEWVDGLPIEKLKEVGITAKSGLHDQAIRKIAMYHPAFLKIEAFGIICQMICGVVIFIWWN